MYSITIRISISLQQSWTAYLCCRETNNDGNDPELLDTGGWGGRGRGSISSSQSKQYIFPFHYSKVGQPICVAGRLTMMVMTQNFLTLGGGWGGRGGSISSSWSKQYIFPFHYSKAGQPICVAGRQTMMAMTQNF